MGVGCSHLIGRAWMWNMGLIFMKYIVCIYENSQGMDEKLGFSAHGKGIVLKEDKENHAWHHVRSYIVGKPFHTLK